MTDAGTFRFQHRLMYIANALVNQHIGLEETDDGVSAIHFTTVLLAMLDERDFVRPGRAGGTSAPVAAQGTAGTRGRSATRRVAASRVVRPLGCGLQPERVEPPLLARAGPLHWLDGPSV